MSTTARFSDEQYKNWLKCSLSLITMKEALHEFIHNEVNALHRNIKQNVSSSAKRQCGSCSWYKIKKAGDTSSVSYSVSCQKGICDKWLQQILLVHEEPHNPNINWKNADISRWPTDCYEVAKVFMPKGQNKTTKMPDELDAPAVLSLLKYCSWFGKHLQNKQILSDLIEIRDKIFHSGDLRVSDRNKDRLITLIIKLLIDLKINGDVHSELTKLQTEDIDISFRETELKILKNLISGLVREYKEVQDDIASLQDSQSQLSAEFAGLSDNSKETNKKVDKLQHDIEGMRKSLEEIKNNSEKMVSFFDEHEGIIEKENREIISNIVKKVQNQQAKLIIVERDLNNVKTKVSLLERDQEEIKKQTEGTKQQVEGVDRRLAVLEEHMEYREQHSLQKGMNQLKEDLLVACKLHTTIPLSPFCGNDESIPVQDFYMDVLIQVKNKENIREKRILSFKQMFLENSNKRIILTGLSGCGKTTVCKSILYTWCKEQSEKKMSTVEKIDTDGDEVIADGEILSKFMFVFYIYTPKIADESDLHDVLCSQCVHSKPKTLKKILQEYPDKILMILDGIDEMGDKIPVFLTKLLERNLYPRITLLMVMRQWKIYKLGLKRQSHYDLLLIVEGLSEHNALKLVEKVIDINCRIMKKEQVCLTQYEKQLFSTFKTVPLLLLFLAHIRCQVQALPNRQTDLYKKILECSIQRCISKTDKYGALAGQDITDQIDIFWRSYMDSASKVAHHFLLKDKNVAMREKDLMRKLGDNASVKLSALLDCGVLSKEDIYAQLENYVSITFIHVSIQEYLTALYLVDNKDAFQNFLTSLTTLNDILKFENLFIFICGLNVILGHEAFSKICQVCDQDPQVLQYRKETDYLYMMLNESVSNLNHMYKACLYEMDQQERVEMSDLVLDERTYSHAMARLKSTCLKSLSLHDIPLESGKEIKLSHLTNLTSLSLYKVELSKESSRLLCISICSFTYLENLHLEYMILHEGVLNLSTLTNLTSLNLYKVAMSEECCQELCSAIINCTLLNKLYLVHIRLYDAVLNLTSLTNLTSLALGNVMSDKCSKSLCSSISGCTNLKELELIRNTLYDSVLDLRTLTNLTSLVLCKVSMSEECSTCLCRSISCCSDLRTWS